VRYGLDALAPAREGLRSLLELARLEDKRSSTRSTSASSSRRGLSALGRIGTAMDCVDLLVSDDETRIGEILSLLEKSNRHRKGIEDEMFEQAIEPGGVGGRRARRSSSRTRGGTSASWGSSRRGWSTASTARRS
jgi:single-stranded DNA-specific DHH superfamily exonuclease